MISEERLQELIKQEATIWADDYGEIQLCDKSEVCDTIAFPGNHQIQEGYCLSGFVYNNEFISDNIEPDGLEEDIEKGKWCYEMHASRLEQFEQPDWEEINENTDWRFRFFTRDGRDYRFIVSGVLEYIELDSEYSESYCFDFTKEDYIKACTIARKLFLGENIEKGEKNEESKN